jgi:hypothetical protein
MHTMCATLEVLVKLWLNKPHATRVALIYYIDFVGDLVPITRATKSVQICDAHYDFLT